MPKTISTQVEYRIHDGTHFFTGRDRISSGVMVGNADFQTALKDLKKQLREALKANQIGGAPVCTLSDKELESAAVRMSHMMTLWTIDNFAM